MNICLVVISSAWAGAELVVHELASDRGENVCIVLNQEITQYYKDLKNVELLNVGPLYHTTGLIRACISPKMGAEARDEGPDSYPGSFYPNALLRELYYKRLRGSLIQSVLNNRIDIIHAHLNAGIVLASNLVKEREIPFIATLHGLSVEGMDGAGGIGWLRSPVASWRNERFRNALEKADKITAVSTAELDAVENCNIPLKDKSIVIPNGVNIQDIQSSVSSIATLKGDFNLLFPGGAKFVKGGDLLIKALPEVKRRIGGIHLYIAGNVPRNHMLRKMVVTAELDKNVTFKGFLGIREYRQLLNSVDLLIVPSRKEYFGIVFLEAMALGKPIIGGNVGGVPEVVENGRNGILVTPDSDQIADAIVYLYRNDEVRQTMCQNNLHDVARWDWKDIIQRYMDLYRDVLC